MTSLRPACFSLAVPWWFGARMQDSESSLGKRGKEPGEGGGGVGQTAWEKRKEGKKEKRGRRDIAQLLGSTVVKPVFVTASKLVFLFLLRIFSTMAVRCFWP